MTPEEMKEAIRIIDGRARQNAPETSQRKISKTDHSRRRLRFQRRADTFRTDPRYFPEKSASDGGLKKT